MFGDIGHGFLLFLMAAYLCMNQEKLIKGALGPLLKARHLLLLMGFFATYAGLIYNDMMSLPLNIFGSCYSGEKGEVSLAKDCVYPFGIDPKWYVSKNELQFMNSLKMKLAVIYGVVQMTLGILMKGANYSFHRLPVDFLFEFVPQLVFLLCLFGFMDAMIVTKWLTDYTGKESKAPSIITQMINNALNGGQIDGEALFGGGQQGLSN